MGAYESSGYELLSTKLNTYELMTLFETTFSSSLTKSFSTEKALRKRMKGLR